MPEPPMMPKTAFDMVSPLLPAAGSYGISGGVLEQRTRRRASTFSLRDSARVVRLRRPSRCKRAQGMPDDGLAHGPPAAKKAGGSHHRFSQIIRHSLRDGLRLIRDLPGVRDLLVTVAGEIITS